MRGALEAAEPDKRLLILSDSEAAIAAVKERQSMDRRPGQSFTAGQLQGLVICIHVVIIVRHCIP